MDEQDDGFTFTKQRTLEDVAKEIFMDTADEEIISKPFEFGAKLDDDFPFSVQRFIWQAKDKFHHAGEDEFHVNIELDAAKGIEGKEQITDADLDVLRPIFAAEYLKHAGIKNTEESVKLAKKLVPITLENIEIRTQRKGFMEGQIVVNQNIREHAVTRKDRTNLGEVCDDIRHGMQRCWASVDRTFPKETRKPLPQPYLLPQTYLTQKLLRMLKPVTERKTSTLDPLERATRPKSQASPFKLKWPITVTRDTIDDLIQGFLRAFDLFGYLKCDLQTTKDCIDFIRHGSAPRILYHAVKYCHTTLVNGEDDIYSYIRLRALWILNYRRCDESLLSYRLLSVVLMMIKSCVFVLFNENGADSISDVEVMQSTVFHAIDELLNPHHVFDSLEKSEDYRAKLPRFHLERGKTQLVDMQALLDMDVLTDEDLKVVKMMVNPLGLNDLMYYIGNESWGDSVEIAGTGVRRVYNEQRIAQKMIDRDLEELNKTTPRKPPRWVSERPRTSLSMDRAESPKGTKLRRLKKRDNPFSTLARTRLSSSALGISKSLNL